jgi:flagellar biosynthesis chaperone FliJ
MKAGAVVAGVLSVAILVGCGNREEELETEKSQLLTKSDSLSKVIDLRDRHFDEVVAAINEVYASIEGARAKEEMITQQTTEAEGKFSVTNDQARADLLDQIEVIDNSLQDSRAKIAKLESKVKALNKDFGSLNETIKNLKMMVEEREATIALLEGRINGLETQVVEQTRQIAHRDSIIVSQVDRMNQVYYVAGTREELENKGLIYDEGGFLWFGETTVISSGVDETYFRPFDISRESTINIPGKINEIVPKRNQEYYAMNVNGEESTDITITNPQKFWQDRYLVIITE